MAVFKAPTAILSEAQEPDAPALFSVLLTGTKPEPAAALPVPDDGTGAVALLPVRKFHVAIGKVVQVGAAGALVTVRTLLALLPVLMLPMKRLPVVFVCPGVVLTTDDVTCTVIVHVPFAATVPLLKLILLAPATGAKVGVPQPLVENVAGVATNTFAGSGSVKI